ncbi:MAG TPA: hypothetical protein DIU00_12485, partial [Phycisphaerales bacterium]|nr:hypothetical protein [Phycisphaerales bacterium]
FILILVVIAAKWPQKANSWGKSVIKITIHLFSLYETLCHPDRGRVEWSSLPLQIPRRRLLAKPNGLDMKTLYTVSPPAGLRTLSVAN